MKKKKRRLAASLSRILILVAILAPLTPLSLPRAKVTSAQTETTLTAPVLSATAAGSSAIELSWTAVPGAVRYELHTQLVDDPGWRQLDGGNLEGTTFRHGDLTPGKTYQYAVRAIDANDQPLGPWSNFPTETVPSSEAATSTSTPAPRATQSSTTLTAPVLTATAAGTNAIDLSWTAVPGAVRYVLFTQLVDDPGWQQIDGGNLRGTTHRHGELAPGKTYQYAVRAIDANNQELGPWSNFPKETVPASGAPTSTPTATSTPTLTRTPGATPTATSTASALSAPSLTATAAGSNAIDLNWTPVRGADRYVLFTQLVAEPGWQQLDGGNLRGTSYRHGELEPGVTYQYAVRAIDANSQPLGPWSNFPTETVPASGAPTTTPTATSTPTLTPTPGATPTATSTASALSAPSLTATAAGSNAIDLNWTPVRGADRYVLFTQLVAEPGWQQLDGGNLRGTSYRHGELEPGVTYQYAVRAIDGNSQPLGPWSNFPTETVPASTTATPTATASATPVAPDAVAERAALVALYQATNGANWTNNDNWLSSQPLSSWQGVTTDSSGHVTGLRLFDNGLSGPLPDLSALTQLTSLNLSLNALTGSIPDLRALTNLTWLDLGANQLTGSIPALSGLTDLRRLNLRDNQLTGPIPHLGALVNLTDLNLYNNGLSGPIPDLSALANLTNLALGSNALTGPIPDLSGLTSLTVLFSSDNQLTGSIPDLSALSNLTRLDLRGNRLTGSIPDLSALTELTLLYIGFNQLTGPIPDLSGLTKLTSLSLKDNQLCQPDGATLFHSNAAVLAHLQSLALPSCSHAPTATPTATPTLTPTPGATATPTMTPTATAVPPVPAAERAALVALYNATDGANWTHNDNWLSQEPIATWHGVFTDENGHVAQLVLTRNGLSGPIPDLNALTKLTNLDLGLNRLSGSIPDLSALTKLTNLELAGNELSGSIPDLSDLTSLQTFSLSHNDLTGQIPSLSALTGLTYVNLSSNDLSGPIPELNSLTNLSILYLSRNGLTGQIPNMDALTHLSRLSLASNELTGEIADLSALTRLSWLFLYDYDLTGQIPDLSALTNLTVLDLSDNDLTGTIATMGAVNSLWRLTLSSNKLSGEIPDLSALTNLRWLYLNGNELTGQISDLSALTALTHLDLGDNQLSGPVPDLSALTNLSELSLSNNQLSGPILDFGALTNLRKLILNNNQLSGPVPELGSLTTLETLSLADNRFCLPADYDFSASSNVVTNHLNSLSLATCTDAELAAVPGVPQNLSTTISGSQVTISWDAASNAVNYDLWTWDSINRQWGSIGGTLTNTTYRHSVQTDGRNYYYQVRARDANDVRGAWSERVAAVLSTQFPPPPSSLGLNLFFQKYLEVGGIIVVAPSEVSDEQMVRSRGVISGMLKNRSDLIQFLADNDTRISIHGSGGNAADLATGWVARVALEDPHCGVLIHELAHLIHFAIRRQSDGQQFETRLTVAYQAALKSGLWERLYAATNTVEYWAETVRFWFQEFMPYPLDANFSNLSAYDPEIAKLIEEAFGSGATVPATCKP